MLCPYCLFDDTRVIETRASDDEETIRRRRECQRCRRRFTTYERHEEPQLYVIKKDGRREPFDRNKILLGVVSACRKRPISREQIEALVYKVERILRDELREEVPTTVLGNMIMERLRVLDEVAYVRFASVYKEFHDLTSFREEIERMYDRARQDRLEENQEKLFDVTRDT